MVRRCVVCLANILNISSIVAFQSKYICVNIVLYNAKSLYPMRVLRFRSGTKMRLNLLIQFPLISIHGHAQTLKIKSPVANGDRSMLKLTPLSRVLVFNRRHRSAIASKCPLPTCLLPCPGTLGVRESSVFFPPLHCYMLRPIS